MSLEAFLNEAEKPESSGGGAFITVAKVRVFFCWQGWSNGKSELFEYAAGSAEAEAEAKVECQTYIDSGTKDGKYDQWPQKGICTHIEGTDVPTNAEGHFHWGDIEDFVKKYESDVNANFTEEELKLVSGPMPFNLVINGLKNNPSVADEKPHWVKLSQEINQWSKAKGKKNKKGYDLRVHVVQHVYTSEKEAKYDAENIKAGQATSQPQVDNGQLSAKALETWGSLEALKAKKAEIENAIQNAVNGIGSSKMSKAKAQAHAAEGYVIEEADLATIGIEIVPF